MNKHFYVIGALVVLATSSMAQQPQPTTAPAPAKQAPTKQPPTKEQYERAIQQLDAQIVQLDAKLKVFTESVLEVDASIEKRIDRIVNDLKSIQDSEDSGTRVSMVKEDIIKSLYTYIQFVVRERDMRVARLEGQPGTVVPRYGLEKDIEFLDARLEKRVDQIIELSRSFGVRDANVQRFEYGDDDDDDDNDWRYGETYHGQNIHYSSGGTVTGRQTTDEYRQMRSVAHRGEMTKERAIDNLKASIENLKRKNRLLEQRLNYARNMTEMQYTKNQISKNRNLISRRQEQIYLLQTNAQPGTKQIARQQAVMLEERLREEVADIKTEFRTLMTQRTERMRMKTTIDGYLSRRAQYSGALQKLGGTPTPPPVGGSSEKK
jgi:hypothetical protein